MKNLFILTVVVSLAFSACSNDDYDGIVSLVTVTESSDGEKLFVRSDSSLMNPVNFVITSNVGQRMLVQYEIENSYPTNTPYRYDIDVDDFEIVLTKNVVNLTTSNETEIGNDAFWNIYYVSYSNGFINIYLSFLYNYNPHAVNLVYNTITPPINEPDSINFELRQNANGDNSGFPISEIVSFNVQGYIDAAAGAGVEEMTFAIKVLLPNNNTSLFYVTLKTNAPSGSDDSFNTLDSYNTQDNAIVN